MPKRMKIEFTDDEGSKYTLSVEGVLTKEKMNKIIEVYEFLGGERVQSQLEDNTIFSRVARLIDEQFPASTFTTSDLQAAYEDVYQQHIKITTLSTYLNRLVDRRILKRVRVGAGYLYRKVSLNTKIHTLKSSSTLIRE
ncbi:MAG: hypothetical protein HA494_04100 [Thaumarchaeota archaeon]|jgi:hypothetical protein|nr:hypothetical protein [Nitrososphaerota archaeon]